MPTGATINDSAGNPSSLSLTGLTQSAAADRHYGANQSLASPNWPATGDLNAGDTVALTLTFGESVTVAGGVPTLTLNDGGTATYVSGSGTSA